MYHHQTLANGLEVLAHQIPSMATVSACFYIMSGARDEALNQIGAAHMLEHMLFRGSDSYSAERIRHTIRETGCEINAYTTWEDTCVYVRALPESFADAFHMLADIVQRPLIRDEDFRIERKIVLEELARQMDEPHTRIVQEFYQAVYPNSRLERPLIGSREQIEALNPDVLKHFHQTHYIPSNVAVIITGAFQREQITREIARLETWNGEIKSLPRSPLVASSPPPRRIHGTSLKKAYGIWGWPAPHLGDADQYAAHVLVTILGDDNGIGSRFYFAFQKTGLSERMNAVYTGFTGTGMFKIYGLFPPKNEELVRTRLIEELDHLAKEPVSLQELNRAKQKIKTQLAIDASTSDCRMVSIAKAWSCQRRLVPLPELIAQIEAVTVEDINRVINRFSFAGQLAEIIYEPVAKPTTNMQG